MRRSLVLVSILGLLLASCGEPKNRYLAEQDERVFLRVPHSWSEVELTDADVDFLTDQTTDARLLWRAGASANPDATSTADLTLDDPFAIVKVYEVDGQLNQRMSVSLARLAGAAIGFDPVLPTTENESLAEVLVYNPGTAGAPLQGSRTVFRSRDDVSADWSVVVDLTTYFDPATFRLYVLRVGCSPACYEANEELITEIANSWSVEP